MKRQVLQLINVWALFFKIYFQLLALNSDKATEKKEGINNLNHSVTKIYWTQFQQFHYS